MNETRPSKAPRLDQAAWQHAVLTGRWERLGQPVAVLEPATERVIGLARAQEVACPAAAARNAQCAWAGTNSEGCI